MPRDSEQVVQRAIEVAEDMDPELLKQFAAYVLQRPTMRSLMALVRALPEKFLDFAEEGPNHDGVATNQAPISRSELFRTPQRNAQQAQSSSRQQSSSNQQRGRSQSPHTPPPVNANPPANVRTSEQSRQQGGDNTAPFESVPLNEIFNQPAILSPTRPSAQTQPPPVGSPSHHNLPWDDAQRDRLLALLAEQKGISYVAQSMGRTNRAINKQLQSILVDRFGQLSDAEICNTLNINQNLLNYVRNVQ
ncbi:hypothetical protein MP228_005025 [Amoeboaphelidium protococcarum]|nr:hypothetical protein MP228_005025 [Amoeboaphelidium protococcarum]